MKTKLLLPLFCLLTTYAVRADDFGEPLSGTAIGSNYSIDLSTYEPTQTKNLPADAFDGNSDTYFAAFEWSYGWVGLDLGTPHVITRIGYQPIQESFGTASTTLGIFEGANRSDFMDAVPLHIIDNDAETGEMTYADTRCTKGFRYVRYVGPADMHCVIAELEFYGSEGEGTDEQYCQLTNLPVVIIHTEYNNEPIDKINQIPSQITIISDDGRHLLTDSGTVRLRGNYSKSQPKAPYRIKFQQSHNVVGSPAKAKKWTLINNYGDKTLMRNQLAFELSRRFGMPYTPFCTYVDVILNGEYKGSYQLCDQVTVEKNRVNIEKMTANDNDGENLTGGYFIEADAYADGEYSMFYSDFGTGVTIKYPDEDKITWEQAAYIEDHYNKMEHDPKRYLDRNTYLRHFLVGETSGNTDTYWSVFFYKHRGNDTIYTGPVWDFDLAFENDNRTYPISWMDDYVYRSGGSYTGYMAALADAVAVNDAEGREMLRQIWEKARQGGLTVDSFIDYIDEQEQLLMQSQRLNFMRWDIMNEYIHQNPIIWGSYEAEVENVRNYIRYRIPWMDEMLDYVYTPPSGINDSINYDQTYDVFTIEGQPAGNTINALKPGIYVIKQGSATRKVVIR